MEKFKACGIISTFPRISMNSMLFADERDTSRPKIGF